MSQARVLVRRWSASAVIAFLAAAGNPARAQTSLAPTQAPAADPRSVLHPGDVLRLKIWREPDWSGDYQVDEHGMAVLPRLGETRVVEIPIDELRSQLVGRYREFLNNPSVEVTPLRRIAVLGAVKNPGLYPVDPSVTMGQVVNVAGGPLPESKRNVVELRRGAMRKRLNFDDRPDLAGMTLESGDQIYVPERSWLSRNATWFVSTLVAIGGTSAYLFTH